MKDVTQVQQRPASPTVTLTWHASKYKVHKLHQRYILKSGDSDDGNCVRFALFMSLFFTEDNSVHVVDKTIFEL